MIDETPYIEYDILKVKSLKEEYTENMRLIKEFLPERINWDSPKKVKEFITKTLEIAIENVRIDTLAGALNNLDHDSEKFDILNGYLMYLRQKFSISNYINCILRHEESGRVYLRHHEGHWVLPNKRPLSGSPDIIACETGRNGV